MHQNAITAQPPVQKTGIQQCSNGSRKCQSNMSAVEADAAAALEDARRLIEETGYHRRDEELVEATEAAKSWPD